VIHRRVLLATGVAASFLLPDRHAAASPPTRGYAAVRHAPPSNAPIVVLDPGHGGKDPGAIGVSGTYEKHVALAAALELKRQLESGGHYQVFLTRSRDQFVPLEQRVDIAQRRRAALFVSMHADALTDHSVRGASVYTLGEASDAQTAALARRENAADRFGVAGFRDTPPEVARILASLVRQETRAGSSQLAHDVVTAMGSDMPLLPNPSRHAAFVVLKAADIPSVLVEMGFMSNRQDETALRRPPHRVQVAQALCRAVDAYFAAHPSATRMTG
jgi:N-acetylmuramoyl-L-alanine amidase